MTKHVKMYTSIQLIELLKSHYGVTSDYAIAKKLGLTHQNISSIRNNKSSFGVHMCFVIAEILQLDPVIVVASIQVEGGERRGDIKAVETFKKYA